MECKLIRRKEKKKKQLETIDIDTIAALFIRSLTTPINNKNAFVCNVKNKNKILIQENSRKWNWVNKLVGIFSKVTNYYPNAINHVDDDENDDKTTTRSLDLYTYMCLSLKPLRLLIISYDMYFILYL